MRLSHRHLVSSLLAHFVLVVVITLTPVIWSEIRASFITWMGLALEYEEEEMWNVANETDPLFLQR